MNSLKHTWPRSSGPLCIALVLFTNLLCGSVAVAAAETKKENEETSQASTGTAPPTPAFNNLRFQENWDSWTPPQDGRFWDSWKSIQVGDQSFLSFGGQFRFRGEFWKNFGFGGPGNRDDAFSLFRLRLHGDFRLSPYFRFFIEGKSAIATGRDLPGGNRTLDTDSADFQNAFLDLSGYSRGDTSFTLRIGRQELQFGRQRLVSPLDWANSRRTFDGVSGIVRKGQWRFDGFWSRAVRVRKYDLNDHGTDTDLFGFYATGQPGGRKLDVYWLGYDRQSATFGGITGEELRHTLGARYGGALGNSAWDFDLEAGYQFGDHADRDISAYMLTGEVGVKPTTAWSMRIFTAFDYASGDKREGNLGTFNQMFPLGHAWLGHVDVLGRQNLIAWSQGLSIRPLRKLTLVFAHHFFWRARITDDLYNVGGRVSRPALPGAGRYVGNEFNLDGRIPINRFWAVNFGYGRFFAGTFIQDTGPSDDISFGYAALQMTF